MKAQSPALRSLLVSLALCALALPAWAGQVVVKNDSLRSDPNSAGDPNSVIVGDFLEGEQAGARLTSPCNGTIVAVQILWLEGLPGHGDSLEDSIHIYNGSTFPAAGTELAYLEGPVLSPGYWNEFRYLDEAGTIPLNVPVTNGQQFDVTLQFADRTDVGNGGPSVVRDVDGCQSGKNVIFAIPGGWVNPCTLNPPVRGDFGIRAVILCPDPTGACCYTNGSCVVHTQVDCTGSGGTYQGNNTTCSPNPCPQPQGACCLSAQRGCLNMTLASCAGYGGVFGGVGTHCNDSPAPCDRGACCVNGQACTQTYRVQCVAAAGTFHAATTCDPSPCLGACCYHGACFPDQTKADCDSVGGRWSDGAPCTPNPCTPQGCRGDMNCDEQVTFADIDLFVAALSGESTWTHTCPWINADCNHDAHVTFADIDPFVALIGTTCP